MSASLLFNLFKAPKNIVSQAIFLKTDAAWQVFVFILQKKDAGAFFRHSELIFSKVVFQRLFHRILFKSGYKT